MSDDVFNRLEKDLYIKLLDYGFKNPQGFNFKTIKEYLKLNEYDERILEINIENAFINTRNRDVDSKAAVQETIFLCLADRQGRHFDEGKKYVLTLEARGKYIDYLELTEARKFSQKASLDAKRAINIAKWALIVSIIIAFISIIFSLIQILRPIKIDKSQFNQVIEYLDNGMENATK